jgi:hypothetical protein
MSESPLGTLAITASRKIQSQCACQKQFRTPGCGVTEALFGVLAGPSEVALPEGGSVLGSPNPGAKAVVISIFRA